MAGGLSVPLAGLRRPGVRLFNKSNGVAKVGISVAAGAELEVDEGVAAQLLAQSAAFAKIDDGAVGGTVVAGGAEVSSPVASAPSLPSPAVEEAGGGSARRSSGRRKD